MLYTRAPRLLEELRVAHGDGSFARRLAQLARIDLLAIDDFAIAPITAGERNDLLELLDDRVGTRATLITSQLPVTAWHEWLDDPTLADAILDRIVHAAHKIALKGESHAQEAAQVMTASRNRSTATVTANEHGLPTAAVVRRKRRPPPWTSLPGIYTPAMTAFGAASRRSWTTEIR